MDFLVFVAAASVGCLTTKYLKNTQRDSKGCKADLNGSWYIAGLAHGTRMNSCGDASRNNVFDEKVLGTNPTSEVASTSGSEETIGRDLGDFFLLSIASVPTEYTANVVDVARENESAGGGDICNGSGDSGSRKFEGINYSFQRSVKGNSSLRSRYRNLRLMPLTSLESCFAAQLCNHHAEWGERTRSLPKPSTCSAASSLRLTDRSNVISRRTDGFVREQDGMEATGIQNRSQTERSRNAIGVPPLPSPPTQVKSNARSGISISSVGRRKLYTSNGRMHGIILFSLGVSVGVLSSAARKKTDMDKLKNLLKQTENLVQDLQEELEIKDSVTVKELDNDMSGSQDTHRISFHDSDPASSSNEWHKSDATEELHNPGIGKDMDSMSKIEAELEAERERLGLNVGLGNAQLNMMMDIPKGRDLESDASSGSSTAPAANYAISPRALTLRLHELIESRLEERIQELELALENSQRKVWLMESTQKSRTNRRFSNDMDGPVIMNLSGEALGGYDEAYEESMKFDSSEENTPSCHDNSPARRSIKPIRTTEKIKVVNRVVTVNGTLPIEQDTDSLGTSRDESSGTEDAEDEMLIRQLVERTKRGALAGMKVQQLLYSDQYVHQ